MKKKVELEIIYDGDYCGEPGNFIDCPMVAYYDEDGEYWCHLYSQPVEPLGDETKLIRCDECKEYTK